MAMSDPLGDMLARIRNGQMANKSVIECPYSKLRENVCKVLADEGFIRAFKKEERDNNKAVLFIELKYSEGRGVIRQIDRVSKPVVVFIKAQKTCRASTMAWAYWLYPLQKV